jgi:hypothetical protein
MAPGSEGTITTKQQSELTPPSSDIEDNENSEEWYFTVIIYVH